MKLRRDAHRPYRSPGHSWRSCLSGRHGANGRPIHGHGPDGQSWAYWCPLARDGPNRSSRRRRRDGTPRRAGPFDRGSCRADWSNGASRRRHDGVDRASWRAGRSRHPGRDRTSWRSGPSGPAGHAWAERPEWPEWLQSAGSDRGDGPNWRSFDRPGADWTAG
jgi:hypothetical protein